MIRQNSIETVKKALLSHNQGHLLRFWDNLNQIQQKSLLEQIEELNLEEIDELVQKFVLKAEKTVIPVDIEPIEIYKLEPTGPTQQQKYREAADLGRQLLSTGKIAAFVVAGGQGTRLGFEGPKGNFPISPVKGRTFFKIFAETITTAARRYNTVIPWYIMTSMDNFAQTKQVFTSNDYYGFNRDDVFIFQQGTLPSFDFNGRILLADKAQIACSPDGHGGSLKALIKSGAVEHMQKYGIELLSYWQVDNSLVNIFDPLFIGLHALDKAEMSSKALLKTGPKEKVGNFYLHKGRVKVIEYSDLPDTLAEKRDEKGQLIFSWGSIAIHIISVSFIKRLFEQGIDLPLHRAKKKVPFIDEQGRLINPEQENGIKLEKFIFDALALAERSVTLETLRLQEFAPTKNATGVDSAESARSIITARCADWLESAGIKLPRKDDGSLDCMIEIAPSFALYKDDIKGRLKDIPQLKPGDKIFLA